MTDDELRAFFSPGGGGFGLNPFTDDLRSNPTWWAMPIEGRQAFMAAAQAYQELMVEYTVIGVFPTAESEGNYHFGYTVGLAGKGHAELLVTGTSSGAQVIVDYVYGQFTESALMEGMPDGVPFSLSGEGFCMFAPVPDDVARSHATLAARRADDAGVPFTCRQIVWQDDDGRWPWDDGHRAVAEPDTMPIFAPEGWLSNERTETHAYPPT